MENQHRHITGYRDLTQAEIDLINEIKSHGEALEALVYKLRHYGAEISPTTLPINVDQRWVSIGQTELQIGLMALIRSVAQPDSF